MGFLRSWQNRWTHHRRHPLTSARCIVHVCSFVIAHFFAPPALCGIIIHDDYIIDHDYIDHDYIIMIGYLDINGYVYSNSSATTLVNSVRLDTCVHDTAAMTAGGNRGEGRKAPERDAVTVLTANPSETQLMMAQRRRRQKHNTSNPVVIIRFTPATTEGEC